MRYEIVLLLSTEDVGNTQQTTEGATYSIAWLSPTQLQVTTR